MSSSALVTSIFDRALPSLNATRRQFGLPPLAAFFDQVLRCEGFVVLSSAAFDVASPFVPNHVHYVGPILDDPQWAEPWKAPWSDGNHDPLVLVGFSSTFQDQAPVLRNVVKALAGLRVRALVTLGEMLPEGEVQSTGSVFVVRSAPHGEILPQASLLITHCGHGTTLKALAAGVPMVCMPMGRDQDDTAARVVHAGAGVRLRPRSPARKIAHAVTQVLTDGRFRTNARRVGETISRELLEVDVVAELEKMGTARRTVSGTMARPASHPVPTSSRELEHRS
jgi:MGT family glycosyltransferase